MSNTSALPNAAAGGGRIHLPSIGMAAIAIAGLPAAWNLVARNEYKRHTIEKTVRSKKVGACLLAAAIFLGSGARDYAFQNALRHNPSSVLPIIPTRIFGEAYAGVVRNVLRGAGAALMAAGTTLVVSAFLRLGVTGTYLGDYFGILMEERVTAFPFSHFDNPVYLGATFNFLAAALFQNSAVGVGLSMFVDIVYGISTTYFENPFTAMIYSKHDEERAAAAAKKP